MADKKNLGIYWGSNSLYFVETQQTTPTNQFQVPFGEAARETFKDGPTSIGSMELKSDIQRILHKQNLLDSTVNLSLPSKDIIFRSFIIPWMEDHEIKNVVEFEAGKYIPFSLEKLSFSFHPISFQSKDTRQLRIIFVAIKTDVLSHYLKVLEDISLDINLVEPASVSLIRALNFKLQDVIPKNQTFAIIEKEKVGRITIVDNYIPQFVREFHLSSTGTHNQAEGTLQDPLRRLTGEIRISLDYFNRQYDQLQVKQAILLCESNLAESAEILQKNLPISIMPIEKQLTLKDPSTKELGYLNAYGTSIVSAIDSPVYFDLAKHKTQKKIPTKTHLPRKPIDYKSLVKTAFICIPLTVGAIVGSVLAKQNADKTTHELKQRLGLFQDADISMIEQKEKILSDKLTYFRKIRMESNIASFLVLIPNLLPTGTWIQNLDITYDDTASFDLPSDNPESSGRKLLRSDAPKEVPVLLFTIKGYAYSEDKNQQFILVNQLLRNLKDDKNFSGFFNSIDLETTKAEQLNEFPITRYTIVCKKER
ncbi:MAG: pilus assembly protein PilM [Candidatus Omnitrophica bacterium]|nr:pilus assembly protein PilM [Candidatus Omnitrophota bacterium]